MGAVELRDEQWRALLTSVIPEDRSKYGPGVLLARVVWEATTELRGARRELRRIRRQLERRGLEEPTIASDLGILSKYAEPLVDAVEAIARGVGGLEDTLDRARLERKEG